MKKFCLFAVLMCLPAFAAADYDFSADGGNQKAFQIITVLTSGVKTILLPAEDVTIVHLNKQNDGTTASASTDTVTVMRAADETGTAVTISTDLTDGVKGPIFAGGSITIRGRDFPTGADGKREMQIKASGNGAKVLLIKGSQK